MKYLINWIKKELNPDKWVSSQTTSSEYFYKYGAKIRIGDHLGRDDNDLQIIVVKDLFCKHKQYLVKEYNHPTFVTVPDVKTLKIVLTTFLFHFKNIDSLKTVKNAIKEVSKVQLPSVEEIKDTVNNDKNVSNDTQLEMFNECVQKLIDNKTINQQESSVFGTYMSTVFKQWHDIPQNVKKVSRFILIGRTFDEYLKILNLEFPEDGSWKIKSHKELEASLKQYVKTEHIVNESEDSFVTDLVHHGTISSEDAAKHILLNNTTHIDYIKRLDDFYKKGIGKLTVGDINKMYNVFGTLMSKNTFNNYSKTTEGQKKAIRNMLFDNIPYDYIYTFFNKVFIEKQGKLSPNTEILKNYIARFIKLYRHNIIKFPDEDDFLTYTIMPSIHNILKEEKLQDVTENTIVNTIDIETIDTTDNTDILNNEVIDNTITHVIEEVPQVNKIVIENTYNYSEINITDVSSLFTENHLNIISTVIDKINETQKSTSFEDKRVLDVFKDHYSDIWSRLTNAQRDLCSSIITKERMNLNETDFIINKVFDKKEFIWPVTELCRKYISEYCRRIRESRSAA